MKIYLNLLPEDRKNKIKRKKIIHLIIGQWVRLFFVVLIFIITLLSLNLVLKIQINALETTKSLGESKEEFKKINQYEETFKQTNKRLLFIKKIQDNHLYWSKALSEIEKSVSDKISITKLETHHNDKITLEGIAKTRDDLVRFKESVQNSECFSSTEIPVSNFISKENVNFQIEISLEEDCLKK